LTVSDLARSSEFYRRVFGLPVQNRDDGNVQLNLERGHITLRRGNPSGFVDHFAIGTDRFDQEGVIRELKSRGAEPLDDPDAGTHVKDPDGLRVQLTSNATYAGKPAGFPGSSLDHVSIYTSDLKRSVEFYRRVFGLPILTQAPNQVRLSIGRGYMTLLGGRKPPGTVDHFAIGVDGFVPESIIGDLRSRGAEPEVDKEGVKGLHVKDPDGYAVQIIRNDNGGKP
jgi:catechol 2,3-dioxygenase-like lactoylglutathione lyase family enzyme